jgi:hypothetical protein
VRNSFFLNVSHVCGVSLARTHLVVLTVFARLGRFIMMNSYLPSAPPQLKERINPDHWTGFVTELNEAGTPDADLLLACGIYMSCTCCMFFPKIKAEFEHKVDEAIEKHLGYFAPHVKSMKRAQTDVRVWNPSTDPMARGYWATQTLYYIAIECTESGWTPPPRDDTPISNLQKMSAYV